jgi:ATP-dependent Lon protease
MMTSPDTEFIRILGAATDTEEAPLPRVSTQTLPTALPILGLSDIVIFPAMVAPLLVDTAQSIRLIDDVVEGDRLLGLVLQRKPEAENPLPEDLWESGCAARVLKMLKFPDNTVRVLVEGLWRIRIKKFEPAAPYLRANYELLRDETEDSVELQAMLRNAHKQFEEITKLSTALSDQVKIAALNTEHPGHFADLIAANLLGGLVVREAAEGPPVVREGLQLFSRFVWPKNARVGHNVKTSPVVMAEQHLNERGHRVATKVRGNVTDFQRPIHVRIGRLRGRGDRTTKPFPPRPVLGRDLGRGHLRRIVQCKQ